MELREMQAECHRMAREHGWWDRDRGIPEQIALMHSELSEALEEFRRGALPNLITRGLDDKPEGFGIELADCVIRIMDTCEAFDIDLEHCLKIKMAFNETRPFQHGGKLA